MSEVKPKLRFRPSGGKSFPQWEGTRLGNVSEFYKGKGISKKDIVADGRTPCILYGEIYTHYQEKIEKVYSSTNLPVAGLFFSQCGDVILPSADVAGQNMAVASCVKIDGVALGNDVIVIRTKLDGVYLAYYLAHSKRNEIARLTQGHPIIHLYGTHLANMCIFVPRIEEQRKIAQFLSVIDNKLNALRKKKSLMERYKKGIMQKIFNQELRFRARGSKSFPEWRSTRLSKVCDFHKGKGISKSDVVVEGKTPCILYGEIYTHYQEIIEKVYSYTNLPVASLFFSQRGDVILPSADVAGQNMAVASCVKIDGVALGNDVIVIRTKLDGVYLAYYLAHSKRNEIARLTQGHPIIHLYGTHLANMCIFVPHIEEQRKIAEILSAIDLKIVALENQIRQFENFKKGIAQQIFV